MSLCKILGHVPRSTMEAQQAMCLSTLQAKMECTLHMGLNIRPATRPQVQTRTLFLKVSAWSSQTTVPDHTQIHIPLV